MSTKNLAKTVIEGGRDGYSKYLRRSSSQILRVRNRRMCRALVADPETWDGIDVPTRPRDWDDIGHKDKTNPCDRFLESKAGQHWDDVYSEICKRFDRKTLPGRHIIEDHLVGSVDRPFANPYPRAYGLLRSYRHGPWLDENGILRYTQKKRYW